MAVSCLNACIALVVLIVLPAIHAAGTCDYTLFDLDYDQLYDGLDIKTVDGPKQNKVKTILRNSESYVDLDPSNTVQLNSLSDTTLNVKYVSLMSYADGVSVDFLDQKSNVLDTATLVKSGYLFTADVDVTGVRKLLLSFTASSTFNASNMYFQICTDICSSTSELDSGELDITHTGLSNPGLMLRGSGGLINGSGGANQVEFMNSTSGVTVTITFPGGSTYTVKGFSATTQGSKSISLKMYDPSDDREFRDTHVITESDPATSTYAPFSLPQGVSYMTAEFRQDTDANDNHEDVGVQDIFVTVCN